MREIQLTKKKCYLELLVGTNVRILVLKTDDVADMNEVGVHVVDEAAAVGVAVERPSNGVLNESGSELFRVDFPDFFDADSVDLWI